MPPDFVAQSLPPTVKSLISPPVSAALLARTPFVAVEAPLRVMSITNPALTTLMLLALNTRLCPVGFITMASRPPNQSCMPLIVWLLSWIALPTRFKVPPPALICIIEEEERMMSFWGAVAAEKSSLIVPPPLWIVEPV